MSETGVIKFHCNWIIGPPLEDGQLEELNAWRSRLYQRHLVGEDKNGIGYGNISIRCGQDQFIISGSATGKIGMLNATHYTKVTSFDIATNSLTAEGPIIASSESLTHAMIYICAPAVNAVMHIHHPGLWKKLLNKVPTTAADVEYGTTDMAREVVRLFEETDVMEQKIFVMGGHEEGIVSFGKNLAEAGEKILKILMGAE